MYTKESFLENVHQKRQRIYRHVYTSTHKEDRLTVSETSFFRCLEPLKHLHPLSSLPFRSPFLETKLMPDVTTTGTLFAYLISFIKSLSCEQ